MELFEAISKRHSYRGRFSTEKIPRKNLRRIVQAGIQAPSAKNAQTTEFIIVDDSEIIDKISNMMGNRVVYEAKAIIVCVINEIPIFNGHSFAVEDCAAATENMLLAISALGYASVWTEGALRVDSRAEKIGRLLNVPSNRTVKIILPIGVPMQRKIQREKKKFEQRAWFNKYSDNLARSINEER